MNGNLSVDLWLHPDKQAALQTALSRDASTVQAQLQCSLEELYCVCVPYAQRAEIEQRLREDFLQREIQPDPNRCWAAYRITEQGKTQYFKTAQADELLDAAHRLSQYLHSEEDQRPQCFADTIPQRQAITPDDFAMFDQLRTENTGQVSGVFDIHLDHGLFSAVNIQDGWHAYRIGDVNGAACYAYRKEGLSTAERWARLLDKLHNKELSYNTGAMTLHGTSPLPMERIRFSDEISENNGRLSFCIPVDFDPDSVFGTHVTTTENDDFLSVYATYDLDAGAVCDVLTVVCFCDSDNEVEYQYPLTSEQRETLLSLMDDYCLKQTGLCLSDYQAQYLEETDGPCMEPQM